MTVKKNDSRVFSLPDKLVREVCGVRDNARSFLTNNLPEKVLDLVDISWHRRKNVIRFYKRKF